MLTPSVLCIIVIVLLLFFFLALPLIEKKVARKLKLKNLSVRDCSIIFLLVAVVCCFGIGVHSHSRFFSIYREALGSELFIVWPVRLFWGGIMYSFLVFSSRLAISDFIKLKPIKYHKQCAYIAIGIALIMFLILFFEGAQASNDYLGQIAGAEKGEYDKSHPVFHTVFCCALLSIYDSINTVIISQILFFSFSVYVIARFCEKYSISRVLTVIAVLIATVCTYGIIILAIKDSFYISSCIIAIVGLMVWCISPSLKSAILATFGLMGVGVFRYDGQAIVLLTSLSLIVAMFVCRRKVSHVLLMSLLPCVTIILAHVMLPSYLNATSKIVGTKLAMPAEIVCEVIAQKGNITEEELRVAEEVIMPKAMIIKHHSMSAEYDGRKYMWDYFNSPEEAETYSFATRLSGKEKELLPLAFSVAIKNPFITITHFIEQGRMVWDPTMQYAQPTSLFFFLSVLMILSLIRKKTSLIYYIPFIPTMVVAMTSIFIATTWEPRYTYPIFFGAILSVPYMHIIRRIMWKQ